MAFSLKKKHVLNCMFSAWYPVCKDVTIKSHIIPLPEEFVNYLQDDGPLILPKGAEIGPQSSEAEESNDENPSELKTPEFPELMQQIKDKLQNLNNKAFPKLNWSSPKDAAWISATNTLKCSTPGEVILLLKSSDFITYDLTSPFKLCDDSLDEDPPFRRELVLRKWANLVPGMEFRCFVRDGTLIAACQRQHRQYYEYVDAEKDTVTVEICRFLQDTVLGKFPNDHYVVDVYKKRNGEFWIIDFNPWGSMTDPLLYTWEELESLHSERADVECPIISPDGEVVGEFRYVKKDSTMQPSDMLSYRMPQDFVDLSTGEDATKLVDFLRLRVQDGSQSGSDDDEPWTLPEP